MALAPITSEMKLFNFYLPVDQYSEIVKRIAEEQRKTGIKGSVAGWVRDAISYKLSTK